MIYNWSFIDYQLITYSVSEFQPALFECIIIVITELL